MFYYYALEKFEQITHTKNYTPFFPKNRKNDKRTLWKSKSIQTNINNKILMTLYRDLTKILNSNKGQQHLNLNFIKSSLKNTIGMVPKPNQLHLPCHRIRSWAIFLNLFFLFYKSIICEILLFNNVDDAMHFCFLIAKLF